MTTRIKLDPTAWQSGGRFYGTDIKRARVQVGGTDTGNLKNGMGLGITYSNEKLNTTVPRNSITITENAIDVEDDIATDWTQFTKNQLADLVAKGIIIVEKPVATALTAAQTRAL